MTRPIAAIISLVVAASCTGTREPAFDFTELAYPGADSTAAAGINDAGHVVGWYRQGDLTAGFLYKNGAYSPIRFPGAVLTQLTSIGSDGVMTGSYRMPDETSRYAYHGFLLTSAGEFREIAHPEYAYSMAMRVLAAGDVIGCYHQEDGIASMRAVTVPAAALTPDGVVADAVHIRDEPTSMHNDATPDGSTVVGILMDSGRAYVIERGVFRLLEAPHAKKIEAWGVSPSGIIVGATEDIASVERGFVLEDGRFTRVHVPGARSSVAFGVNMGGDVVGAFETADGLRRAFLARRK